MDLFSATEVYQLLRRFIFLAIQDDVVVTRSLNLTVTGSPVLVPGPRGGFALLLDGVDQFASFISSADFCLLNPDDCLLGLSVKFSVEIRTFKDDSYILSCGADQLDTTGVAIWWRSNRLNVRLRTRAKEWSVSADFSARQTQFQQFVDVQFSWNVGSGIDLYLNGHLTASSMKFTAKESEKAIRPNSCLIGKRRTSLEFSHLALADLYIVFASRDVTTRLAIDVGKSGTKNT